MTDAKCSKCDGSLHVEVWLDQSGVMQARVIKRAGRPSSSPR